jgi:LytS/YehU family sensor histidine kinase
MAQAFLTLLPQTVLVYPLLYFILPRYAFNGKYFKAWFFIITLVLIMIAVNAILLMAIPWYEAMWLVGQKSSLLSNEATLSGKFKMAYLLALQGSFAAAGLATCFKLFKDHYVKSIRNQQLLKENVEAQLQFLRAQVHPHFLFNTLNNIYSQTQLESPKGSKMIIGLSDILRYILYEGQKPLVPLKQELLMLTEYINLEKLRYGNKLDIHVLTPDKADDVYIVPLLLLPFVENCFKHGTGNMPRDPWINLTIELKDTTLVMKLINGKAQLNGNIQNRAGIGINNVRQRLDLLYKDKHDLQIREEEEVFVVDLRVELVRLKNKELPGLNSPSQINVAYA